MSRKRIKEVVAVALGILLSGCGRSGDGGKGVEVEYNCPANAAEIAALQGELPTFTERTGITLKLNPFTGQEKLYAMMAAGQAPDIFYGGDIRSGVTEGLDGGLHKEGFSPA